MLFRRITQPSPPTAAPSPPVEAATPTPAEAAPPSPLPPRPRWQRLREMADSMEEADGEPD